jgi:hypothetical protein
MQPSRSRPALAAALGLVVGCGLLVAHAGLDALGDVLYAVMASVLVLLCAPRARPWVVASVSAAWCAVIEVAQATGEPAAIVDAAPFLRYALGTTFVWTDLLAYAAGVVCVWAVDVWAVDRSSGSARRQREAAAERDQHPAGDAVGDPADACVSEPAARVPRREDDE